ncbi:SEFIR domain-containing protein [Lysinibacillus xylanilyticus]|uniref:SEFIR domain-containing protein n=1 Tax=Lysinibacillus xylanilyticus TaxID=582475 RepID=UPI003D996D5D
MIDELKAQKTFISYSWSTLEHEDWVIELAERLVNHGVEVVLDKWDSEEGQNLNAFMQRCVTDSTIEKVLIVCDKIYTEKADGFKGGVGTESVIISNEVYQDVEQTKFIAIVAERDEDGNEYMPTYLKGTKYIDMSNAQSYEDGYQKLIRNLYGKPEFCKPSLGKAPSFLLEEKKNTLNCKTELKILIHQVNKSPKKFDRLISDFFEHLRQDFASFSLKFPVKGDLKELLFSRLNEMIELRDVYIEFLDFYILEADKIDDYLLIEFFESLYPLVYSKEEGDGYFKVQFDHMKFFVMEIMIYTIAVLYKYKKYTEIKEIVNNAYMVRMILEEERICSIGVFRFYPEFIESVILPSSQQRYISNSGKLLIERANYKNISGNDIVEADFLIYLLTYIFNKQSGYDSWYPPTLPYFSNESIKFLSKLKSKKFYESCKIIFGDIELEQLKGKIDGFKAYLKDHIPSDHIPFSMSRYYLSTVFYDSTEIAKY